jgi:hypothetical protein
MFELSEQFFRNARSCRPRCNARIAFVAPQDVGVARRTPWPPVDRPTQPADSLVHLGPVLLLLVRAGWRQIARPLTGDDFTR